VASDGLSRPGWVCDGCGKHVTGSIPVSQCADCGGRWFEATPEQLACDRCGDRDASRVFNSEHNRLCEDCIAFENQSQKTGTELAYETVECWRCGNQRYTYESCHHCGASCKPLTKQKQQSQQPERGPSDPHPHAGGGSGEWRSKLNRTGVEHSYSGRCPRCDRTGSLAWTYCAYCGLELRERADRQEGST